MRKDKLEAFKLRKEGKNYREIRAILGVSKGTLSGWFKNFDWSGDISKVNHTFNYSPEKIRKMHEARTMLLKELYDKARLEGQNEFGKYKNEPLFAAGLMVYAGEGDHSIKSNLTRIANSNSKIILVFKSFLSKYYPEFHKKIRISILLYPDLDDKFCLEWWSSTLKIPLDQFHKPVHIVGRHKTRRLQYGVASLIISSKFFKTKLLEVESLALEDFSRTWSSGYDKRLPIA